MSYVDGRPRLEATLESRRLDLDDLAGFVGATPQVEGFDTGSGFDAGDGWKVVDVTWDGGVWADTCQIDPVLTTGGDYVVQTGPFSWP